MAFKIIKFEEFFKGNNIDVMGFLFICVIVVCFYFDTTTNSFMQKYSEMRGNGNLIYYYTYVASRFHSSIEISKNYR